jgi:DNA-directed RNA polymerase subunit RPC12/RpoP
VLRQDAKTSAKESMHKGINSEDLLKESVHELLKQSPQIHIETDMRAFYNPTRMINIAKATEDLVRKLQQLCPNCNFVNFDVVKRLKGLPCELCGLPTQVTRAHVYRCDRCQFQQEVLFPDEIQVADPMYCAYCNP